MKSSTIEMKVKDNLSQDWNVLISEGSPEELYRKFFRMVLTKRKRKGYTQCGEVYSIHFTVKKVDGESPRRIIIVSNIVTGSREELNRTVRRLIRFVGRW